MDTKLLLEYSLIAETVISVTCLLLMARKKLLRDFYALAGFLAVLSLELVASIGILFFRKELGVERQLAFHILFYGRWAAMLVEYPLVLLGIYKIFSHAMKPLKGLHRFGTLIFRWVSAISILLSLGLAVGPHLGTADHFFGILAERVQQGTSVLMLCLLVFVCLAIRPLGLTYRSRVFGISLGMGIFSTCSLISAAWLATIGSKSIYSPVYLVSSLGFVCGLVIWIAYFAVPEPARQMVMLPTTSPYFFWNKLSEALGDPPGNVVVAGFRPEMLAKAEMENLKAASRRARERERQAGANAVADQAASAQLQPVPATR